MREHIARARMNHVLVDLRKEPTFCITSIPKGIAFLTAHNESYYFIGNEVTNNLNADSFMSNDVDERIRYVLRRYLQNPDLDESCRRIIEGLL